jgi:rRNA maturation protein Nop10
VDLVNHDGEVVHPNAPRGAGGPGFFRKCGPLGCDVDTDSPVPHVHSPAARYVAYNDKQKKRIKQQHAARRPAPKVVDDPALNAKVKKDADAMVGKPVVGSGECYDFADQLLSKAGAKSAPDFDKITPNANYKWGAKIKLSEVKAGDVLQFRDHKIVITTVKKIKKTSPDGSWRNETENKSETHIRPHHTAVVSSVESDGSYLVIEQHVKDPNTGALSKVVRQNKLFVNSSKPTRTKSSRKEGTVTIEEETTVTITTSGDIAAYHPQPH